MIGKTLLDRYRIDAELGRGGMGVVYRGFDLHLNRLVAIKVISTAEMGSEVRSRLLAEARAAARLNHPNIVTVFDASETEGVPFIIMELVEGGTLRSVPQPGIRKIMDFARQICAALAHAHDRGIIHRDIKPDNVLVSPSGLVKLMDFGLARSMDTPHITDAGLLVGTFAYLAPELIQGGEPGPQSDLYALGIVMYEMLTGDLPFKSKDIAHLFAELIRGMVTPPRELNPDIPEMLNTLVLKLLNKNPQERPESAKDVESQLALLLSERPITRPAMLNPSNAPLDELADSRTQARKEWEKDWRKKSYPKSSMPVLAPGEKEQIFANREKELADCLVRLTNQRLLVITGMPGIGKSTLARALLEFLPPDAPPPFWYDFDRHKASGNTLGILLDRISSYLERCLGGNVREEIMSFRDSPQQQASAHDVDVMIDYLGQGSSLWLVFDNLETVLSRGSNEFEDEGLEMLFDGLKSNSHNARIILTTPLVPKLQDGEFLLEYGAQPLTLQGLNEPSAIKYLQANGLQDYAAETLAPVTRLVDGHPFALKHAARYILTMGMAAAMDNLQEGLDGFLEHFHALLQQRLSDAEINALQQLTVLQRDIPIAGLCKTAQARPAMMERLREAGLLEKNQAGNFWLPSLVRASLNPQSDDALRPAHARAMEFYRTQKRVPVPRQIDDYADVIEWHYHAAQAGEISSAYAALDTTGLDISLHKWNEFVLLANLCENTLLAAGPGRNGLSNLEWANLHRMLGSANFYLRNAAKSLEEFATAYDALFNEDESRFKLLSLIGLCNALYVLGRYSAAAERCQQAFAILETYPDERLLAEVYQLKGMIARAASNFEQAIQDLETSRKLFESAGEQQGMAYATGELGIAYYYDNQFDKALENHQRASQAGEQAGDVMLMLLGHLNSGDILLQQGIYESASNELAQALRLAKIKKLSVDQLSAGLYLVDAQIGLGLYAQAQQGLDELSNVLVNVDSPLFSGQAARLRASLNWRQGRMSEAGDHFENAFALLKGDDCGYERGRAQLEFSAYLKQLGKLQPARTAARKARKEFESINNQLAMQTVDQALTALENE